MGELKTENIKAVLEHRDMAAATLLGRAAATLARLDYEHYEQSIDESQDELRLELLDALKKKDEAKLEELLHACAQPSKAHDHPMYNRGISVHRAHNLLVTEKPIAAKWFGESAWKAVREMVSASYDALNYTALGDILSHIDKQTSNYKK